MHPLPENGSASEIANVSPSYQSRLRSFESSKFSLKRIPLSFWSGSGSVAEVAGSDPMAKHAAAQIRVARLNGFMAHSSRSFDVIAALTAAAWKTCPLVVMRSVRYSRAGGASTARPRLSRSPSRHSDQTRRQP